MQLEFHGADLPLLSIYADSTRLPGATCLKVETSRGVSVAVAGLPDPRNDHHVVMARFARDCSQIPHHDERTRDTLGPDTTDLGLSRRTPQWSRHCRVLRGDRARLRHLANTTARVETTGMPQNKIHISHERSPNSADVR
jgi:hypothetical protein